MKAIYLDTFAGVSGNMFLGALLDAGYPFEVLKAELEKLNLGEYELVYQQVNKLGIEAKYFNVLLPEGYEHHHNHEHEHHHEHEHEHHHNHEHEHHHEHEHEHHHEHEHELPHTHHHHEHRNLKAVMDIINNSTISDSVKAKAEAVFTAIAKAEGKVHGKPLDEVHFHEVGAIDTIIDIVGTLLGLEYLGIEKIYCGRINTGFGTVQCAHGIMPVPAPATAELLMGLPVEKGIVEKEMTTPTGAALVKVLAEMAVQQPDQFAAEHIAYGAGSRECIIPNVLRMYVGNTGAAKESLIEGSCNIDDMTGEILGYTMEKLINSGLVKDVWAESIYMKKNRPAYKLCFLTETGHLEQVEKIIFAETSTLGIRYYQVERAELQRSSKEVATALGAARVKCGSYAEGKVKAAPEYEDCRVLAEKTGMPLREVMELVLAEAKKHG